MFRMFLECRGQVFFAEARVEFIVTTRKDRMEKLGKVLMERKLIMQE